VGLHRRYTAITSCPHWSRRRGGSRRIAVRWCRDGRPSRNVEKGIWPWYNNNDGVMERKTERERERERETNTSLRRRQPNYDTNNNNRNTINRNTVVVKESTMEARFQVKDSLTRGPSTDVQNPDRRAPAGISCTTARVLSFGRALKVLRRVLATGSVTQWPSPSAGLESSSSCRRSPQRLLVRIPMGTSHTHMNTRAHTHTHTLTHTHTQTLETWNLGEIDSRA
jgi:hypothetical protein